MGLMVEIVFLVLNVCAIAGSLVLQESSGYKISPSPTNFYAESPIIEASTHRVIQKEQMMSHSPSPVSQPNPSPHFEYASAPQAAIGPAPSSSPVTPLNEPSHAKDRVLAPDAAAPYVNNAPSPDSSYESTPSTKSRRPPYLSPLYPPPWVPMSKPRRYAPRPINPGPYVHNAPSPNSSYESTPPTKSKTLRYLSPLYPPPLVPMSEPRGYAPLLKNPVPVASAPSKLPRNLRRSPFMLPLSPSSSPAPYVHNAPSPSSRNESAPPTKSKSPPYLSPLYPPQLVPMSKPRRYAPLPTNPASYVHIAPSPDSSYVSTLPTKSKTPPYLSPLYPPPLVPTSKAKHYAPLPTNLAPYVHNAPSPHSSYESTPPTKSKSPPYLSPLYPPPPVPMSEPREYVPLPKKLAPCMHNAPSPNSSYESTPPTKSKTPPYLSPLYPPPLVPMSKPRRYAPLPTNPAHNASPPGSSSEHSPPTESHPTPSLSPLFSPPPGQMNKPRHYAPAPQNKALSVHNAPSSYYNAPSSELSYEYTPPTKSHIPPSLSPLYPPRPGRKSKPRHYVPPPQNPAPSMHNARPPDSNLESTPPTELHPPSSLSPLYHPPPSGPPWHHAPPPPTSGSALPPLHTSVSPAISPFAASIQTTMPFSPPNVSPLWSPLKVPKQIQALPPPPPNEDCSLVTCKEPLTNTPPGTPCNCVMPMQIALSLGVSSYTFFPLVLELAFEVASGVSMKPSQVRIMGANADDQDPEKTVALIDLIPFGEKINSFTVHLTAQRLWMKQVPINSSLFGDYEVLYVKYPGLPPSPPLPSSTFDNNGMTKKPLGVDVSKHRHGHKLNDGIIAIIVLSTAVAVVLFCVLVWVLLFKRRELEPTLPTALPSFTKPSGIAASMAGNVPTSASPSFRSSMACTGSAKTFSLSDMEKATDNFNESQVLGEGGFGRVYGGLLDDGTRVAVKVLKKVGKQGGQEFSAEVEMLSRLHHRNLVRLIGLCTDERNRCLVYELIPNGSVQSHLHGKDKEMGPLDWAARLKIALGAARGLAYLHEDSSPRVIHRDFKSSNILLEHDFTPKVSDFGLARSALDEENRHITTRIMGTFGYLAPEYAMTGHLLVKSDVYSYGVVLLELLTGRKPVDMSMPPGQENLVTWAQPHLMAPEGLALLIDPMLLPDARFDRIAKVAAIASMCVETDVSHRPSMGEVVQALKLVCTECEEPLGSTLVDFDGRVSLARPTESKHKSRRDLESGCSVPGLGPDSSS